MRKILILVLIALAACTTNVTTNPPRSAMEELLISTAADRAAQNLALQIPKGTKVFVDAGNMDGTDSKYAIAAIHDSLLRQGANLVGEKKDAQKIIEIRAGALSTDQKQFLIGIPQFNVPIPLSSGPLTFPEIALYKDEEQNGIAKLGMTSYDAKTGALAASQEPQFGYAHSNENTILIFYSWKGNDVIPKDEAPQLPPTDYDGKVIEHAPASTPAKP